MEIVKEFSRFAYEYNKYNVIQKEVAKRLTSYVPKGFYNKVLDLGSGDGAIYKEFNYNDIKFNEFVAFDFSKEMLKLHPKNKHIKKVCMDFNKPNSFSMFKRDEFDLLISSSALQWSSNLLSLLTTIAPLSKKHYFSFFTSNTFKTLHKIANITSPIYSREDLIKTLDKVFHYEMEIVEYTLYFNSVHEMLKYIKRSGVSGGVGKLGYKQTKYLLENYPLGYLEFEVLFVKATLKKMIKD